MYTSQPMPRYGELVTATKLFVTTLWLSKLRCAKLWVNMCKMHTIIYLNEAMHLVSKCQPPQEGIFGVTSIHYVLDRTKARDSLVPAAVRVNDRAVLPPLHPPYPHTSPNTVWNLISRNRVTGSGSETFTAPPPTDIRSYRVYFNTITPTNAFRFI